MTKLLKYLKPFRTSVIVGPIFKLTEAIFELLVPLVMAGIIDKGIHGNNRSYILTMGGVLVILGVVGLACALICQYLAAKASQGFGTVLRDKLFAHINTFSHKELDRFGTPSLITRITNDVNQLQLAVAMLIRLVVRAPFLVIGATIMAIGIDWKLSLIFLVIIPLVALTLYIIMNRSIPFYRTIQKKLDRISLITRENLGGARVIRAFSGQNKEEKRFNNGADDQLKSALSVGRLTALLNPLVLIIVNLGILAVVWFGGWRVENGALTQGEVIAFVNYLTQISLALVVVANLVVIFTKAAASATRVVEVLDVKSSLKDGAGVSDDLKDQPRVAFRGVDFSYGEGRDSALEGINIEVEAGEIIGVIGGTGCGKSTLVNLIPRFYDVTGGYVAVDGVDVKEYTLGALRERIGIVPQGAVLFSGTVAENLRWGNENASDEDLWRALEIAMAGDFVEKLPEGLNSPVREGGKNFSGGQRQRLTIARAMVKNPAILILDDASSALDFATDAGLRKGLWQWKDSFSEGDGPAIFMVSQRVNTVRFCSRILVLDDGRMVGLGSHKELLEGCEVYREICLSQDALGGEGNEQ